jgi:hypothetical protein
MKRITHLIPILLFITASIAMAQDSPAMPAPQKEHKWLEKFLGEWETESEASMGPGQPPMKCKGTISCRTLGGFWYVSEMKSEMMGTPMTAIMTLGYDPQSKKYIGTWVDSMLGYMWKYEGNVDTTGKIITFEAEGPNFMAAGKMTKFRDIYDFKSPDQVTISSGMLGDDGKWTTFMTGSAKRKK